MIPGFKIQKLCIGQKEDNFSDKMQWSAKLILKVFDKHYEPQLNCPSPSTQVLSKQFVYPLYSSQSCPASGTNNNIIALHHLKSQQ